MSAAENNVSEQQEQPNRPNGRRESLPVVSNYHSFDGRLSPSNPTSQRMLTTLRDMRSSQHVVSLDLGRGGDELRLPSINSSNGSSRRGSYLSINGETSPKLPLIQVSGQNSRKSSGGNSSSSNVGGGFNKAGGGDRPSSNPHSPTIFINDGRDLEHPLHKNMRQHPNALRTSSLNHSISSNGRKTPDPHDPQYQLEQALLGKPTTCDERSDSGEKRESRRREQSRLKDRSASVAVGDSSSYAGVHEKNDHRRESGAVSNFLSTDTCDHTKVKRRFSANHPRSPTPIPDHDIFEGSIPDAVRAARIRLYASENDLAQYGGEGGGDDGGDSSSRSNGGSNQQVAGAGGGRLSGKSSGHNSQKGSKQNVNKDNGENNPLVLRPNRRFMWRNNGLKHAVNLCRKVSSKVTGPEGGAESGPESAEATADRGLGADVSEMREFIKMLHDFRSLPQDEVLIRAGALGLQTKGDCSKYLATLDKERDALEIDFMIEQALFGATEAPVPTTFKSGTKPSTGGIF